MSQSVSFLYIVVLCQFWLVELSKFQYYLDCDCMFDLFDCIEVYSCEASLFLSQSILKSCLWLIELYSSCCEVKNSPVNSLLHSMLETCYKFSILCTAICEKFKTVKSNQSSMSHMTIHDKVKTMKLNQSSMLCLMFYLLNCSVVQTLCMTF